MKVALVGYSGYWGKKLGRVLTESGHKIVAKIDSSTEKPLGKTKADAAVIASPPETHFTLTMEALRAGMDVLVEKPMAMNSQQADQMARFAESEGRVLSVDSTFCHTAAMDFLWRLDEPLLSYQSVRLAPPMPQAKIPAGWDLVVHDLSILHRLNALGDGVGFQDGPVAVAAFFLPSGGSAFIMASRQWPLKERSITLHFPSGAFFWTLGGLQAFKPGATTSHIVAEEKEEPLKRLIRDFEWRCKERQMEGLTDGSHGTEIIRVLERLFPNDQLCAPGQRRMGNGLHRTYAV